MLNRTGAAAELGLAVHPRMLRHACGYKLTNDGYLVDSISSKTRRL